MSLFSFLRKNEQESAADGSYYSRAEEDSQASRSRKRKSSPGRRDDPVDPVLPEKKRARRRLVGAVALVLAAIIGLPMILDAEPKQPAGDIVIQIPSRDSPPPAVNMSSSTDTAQPADDALDENEEVVAVPQQASTAANAASVPAPPAAAATAAVPAAKTPSVTAPEPKLAASAPSPAAPARAQAPARADDGARALALLEGRPDPRPSATKAEKFVIQVAALASQEKVNELQGRLKRAGIASFTQKVATASGAATRIRVGPFASRDEAEKMRARIVKLGLNGTLVPA